MANFATYTPKEWLSREFITRQNLNHIEQGVALNNELIKDLIEHGGGGISDEIKEYVDNAVQALSAFFRGNFATKAALLSVEWQTTDRSAANYVGNNDYAYIEEDESHNDESWRYIYVNEPGSTENGWKPQYKNGESGLKLILCIEAENTPEGIKFNDIIGTLQASHSTLNKIYLVPSINDSNDMYDEYMTVKLTDGSYIWERFGGIDVNSIVAMKLNHTLTFGNGEAYTFDGSSDVTVPVYNGDYQN